MGRSFEFLTRGVVIMGRYFKNKLNYLISHMFQVYILDNSLSRLQFQTVFRYSKPSRGLVGTMKSARAIIP